MLTRSIASSAIALLCADAMAQTISPATSPRAHWVLTSGVTGTPTQRRDNPGAASNDKLYVFGGYDANAATTVHNALYEFNGTAWTLKTAEGAAGSPVARGRSAIAWDFTRNKLIVFGGDTGTSTPTLLGDTWEWDPTTNTWTDVTPAFGPSARRWPAMAWDPTSGGMLMFGGEDSTTAATPPKNDTWLFLSGAWIPLSPTTTPPGRRQHSVMTRADFGDVFMCAGIDVSTSPQTPLIDTWRWNGSDWVAVIPTTPEIPASANANQAVYDPIRKRVVMQGGQGIGTVNSTLYPAYGGSPTTWCSEFDCITNEWKLYGQPAFGTADPVIGRVSRYFAGFVPALGKIYKVSGQNPSGTGTTTGTCEYQATPVAAVNDVGTGCVGAGGLVQLDGVAPLDRPWLGRNFDYQVTGLAPTSLVLGVFGFSATPLPLSVLLPGLGVPGCNLEVALDVTYGLANSGGTASGSLAVPDLSSLIGAPFYQQALQVEIGGVGISGVSSSNGLSWVFGRL